MKTAEVTAYEQVCGNRMAYKVNTTLGPECKCLRTFYKNQAGFCVVGSHVHEFVLNSLLPFASEYRENDTLEYQQLAQLTARWAKDVFTRHVAILESVYKTTFQRVVADRFEMDGITGFTNIYVTMVFDTNKTENSTLILSSDELASDAFFLGTIPPLKQGLTTFSSSICPLQRYQHYVAAHWSMTIVCLTNWY